MKTTNNIYNYKAPKSGNDEVSFFLTKGRITRKAFFLRLLLVIVLYIISNLVYTEYALLQYEYWKELGGGVVRNRAFLTTFNIFEEFNRIYFPIVLSFFVLIQGFKRIHDVNKSGWYILLPVINLIDLFSDGTKGNNDYGIDPKPQKLVKYFDELEQEKKKTGVTSQVESQDKN